MERNKRKLTEQEALLRLSALCASAEYCVADIKKKMERWELAQDEQADSEAKSRIVQRLIAEQYIDEMRYAHAFVRDKFRYNHWGAVRIARELRMKRISADVIDDALTEIDEGDNLDALRQMIAKKRPTVKGKSAYDIRCKLIRFAIGRGFSIDDVMRVVGGDGDEWE